MLRATNAQRESNELLVISGNMNFLDTDPTQINVSILR